MKLKYGSGDILENEDKQSCHFCTGHSTLICSIILPSISKRFQTVAMLCYGNENEVKIWIRGHNSKMKISRVVILKRDTPR